MTGELDALIEQVGKRGYLLHAFRVDRHGPDVLAAVHDWGGCADVVILVDQDHACAYRTPAGSAVDLFAPTTVFWSYAAGPVWTLRALLTLAPPGHPDAPSGLLDAPPGLGLPAERRLPVRVTLRHVLETGAAEAAAARPLTPSDREHLRVALDEAATLDPADYRRRDSRLHLAIAEVTASTLLTTAVVDIRTRVNELLDAIPLLEANLEHSHTQHRRIVARILSADPRAARRAMAEHLDGTAALLRGFLS